jgi:hexosaminidase
MKRLILLILLFLTVSISAQEKMKPTLMPVPSKIEWNQGQFNLDSTFTVSVTGNPHDRIYPAATRMMRRLSGRTGLFFTQDFITAETKAVNPSMIIHINSSGKVDVNMDETYTLIISSDAVTLDAQTDIGAIRGLETFLQLLDAEKEGYFFPNATINDQPRFRWRGLMLDVARHWMPIEIVKRNLDGMAAAKLNVLHLHLSEDQGFRIESKTFPKLHELGSDGFYFTQEEIKTIIKYADDRGIRVYPEFDIPGHSTAWFVAFPELASAPGPYTIERKWGVLDPVFDPTKEETYQFFDKFFAEMSALFPDEYMHIGGDENNGKHWNANKDIQKFMKENNIKDNHDLQTYFNTRILEILTRYGKKMVGWDEILHPGMPKNIVIQSWRGRKSLYESARDGYTGILSNGYYIDLIQPAEFHYLNDPIPPDTTLPESTVKNIWGGEATMWSELVTPDNVDSRIWPRTAAIAERLWSRQSVRDVDDMYKRMEVFSLQLEELGINHIRNQDMMLRRLVRAYEIQPLKTLTEVVEPVKIYSRHRQGRSYTSFSPYTRVVDAALPESMTGRHFRKAVSRFIADGNKKDEEYITSLMNKWYQNHSAFSALASKAPVLKENLMLSQNLADLSKAGLEAIKMINNDSEAAAGWFDSHLKLIAASKMPYGQAELAVTSGFEELFKAVRGGKPPKSTKPSKN